MTKKETVTEAVVEEAKATEATSSTDDIKAAGAKCYELLTAIEQRNLGKIQELTQFLCSQEFIDKASIAHTFSSGIKEGCGHHSWEMKNFRVQTFIDKDSADVISWRYFNDGNPFYPFHDGPLEVEQNVLLTLDTETGIIKITGGGMSFQVEYGRPYERIVELKLK